jgi:hypothetical protein
MEKIFFFIGDDNFRAIAKYNISDVYAMAVYYLSEELKLFEETKNVPPLEIDMTPKKIKL